MIRVGDILKVKGSIDRLTAAIPNKVWTVVALDPIEDSAFFAVVARSDNEISRTVWLAGRVDAVGRPGYPPSPLRAEEAVLWVLEGSALEDHSERINGDAL